MCDVFCELNVLCFGYSLLIYIMHLFKVFFEDIVSKCGVNVLLLF